MICYTSHKLKQFSVQEKFMLEQIQNIPKLHIFVILGVLKKNYQRVKLKMIFLRSHKILQFLVKRD